MSDESEKLGRNIKRIRAEKGITQGDIVRALGMPKSFVSSIENGRTNPTLATIAKLAKALDVPIEDLIKQS